MKTFFLSYFRSQEITRSPLTFLILGWAMMLLMSALLIAIVD